jgi:hypothetical protein
MSPKFQAEPECLILFSRAGEIVQIDEKSSEILAKNAPRD